MVQVLSDNDAVLAANLEFYRAFTTRNLAAMEALWAREVRIHCVHPGWAPISGRSAVMRSWQDILSNPEAPHVMCHDDQAFLYGDMAIVLCEEELPTGNLIATNTFVREDGEWRMIHHQASPLVSRSREENIRPRRQARR